VNPTVKRGQPLTERELEVLRAIADGEQNWQIGRRLNLAEETVKTHVRHVIAKLAARNRAHAVATGFRQRLIT
jgi:DNA-binding NarL/FixJ family response regulator